MTEVYIILNEISKCQTFISTTSKITADLDLVSGRYIIDAKSMMGLYSLDLSKPVKLVIHESGEEAEKIIDSLANAGIQVVR